jgi:2-polyprenyl-3-methyl-5-hydroxy-6-metoxy-1,4-benzoquinol methylase/tetratricopeptide (TPR) repeat protein
MGDRVPAARPIFEKALTNLNANRLPEAANLFKQVLALDPRHADSLSCLGSIALRLGRAHDAINLSQQTLTIDADHVGAHRTLANAFALTGQLTEAEKHYKRALALKPDANTYANLASTYVVGNNTALALQTVLRGLKVEETSKLKTLFVSCLKHAGPISADDAFRALLTRAISEPWMRPGDLASVSCAILKTDPAIAAAIENAVRTWPARTTLAALYGANGLVTISRDRLFSALLANTQLADEDLERMLTLTRSALLNAVAGHEDLPDDEDTLSFFCALAQQCFTNDYVFAQSAEERDQVLALGEQLSAMGERADPLAVAAFASYEPLHTLKSCEMLQDLTWPAPLREVFERQVREPLAQRALRGSIPQLTPIGDAVSALVREQYEENPYPRWVKTASDLPQRSLDQHIRSRVPGAPYRPLGRDTADILVAGCGTGQEVVETASTLPGARITAIDLSLSSLCYAKYRTEAAGIRNVTYGHADILELGALGRSFDVIYCGGVLHHMHDPLKGWRTLLSLLRPHGLMEIALYSEEARVEIVAARELIAQRGYGQSADDIRRARQDILALDAAAPARAVCQSGDFFGVSTCRDLLFHVQEQRFTLSRIKAFLEENGLAFLGFALAPQQRQSYLALFPGDPAGVNLDNWREFETRHPAFFRSMYHFHIQKNA